MQFERFTMDAKKYGNARAGRTIPTVTDTAIRLSAMQGAQTALSVSKLFCTSSRSKPKCIKLVERIANVAGVFFVIKYSFMIGLAEN
jgi:hypothetical protein